MYALLIADDADDAAIFPMALQRVGLAVTIAKELERAMKTWVDRPADIILLAVSKPSLPEQVRLVRAETQVPLIISTNRADERLHIELLKLGADLVIGPSFSIKLLMAQISVLMRRANSVPTFSLPTLSAPGLTMDPSTRTIEVLGKAKQRLTHLEFRLLYTLMTNRGQVMPSDAIVERVWGYTGQGDRDLVRGLISRLRNKVEPDPRKPRFIITLPGVGYSFEGQEQV